MGGGKRNPIFRKLGKKLKGLYFSSGELRSSTFCAKAMYVLTETVGISS